MHFTEPFVRPDPVLVDSPVNHTFYNGQFDPIKDFIDQNQNIKAVSVSNNYTILNNDAAYIQVNNTTASRTITLPNCASQRYAIAIKKSDTTFNAMNIVTQGGDTIESPTGYALNPSGTSISVWLPDTTVYLVPSGTTYRILSMYEKNRIAFRAGVNANVTMVANSGIFTTIPFNDRTSTGFYDISNNFDPTARRFTAPGPGLYEFNGSLRFSATSGGTSFFVAGAYLLNGSGAFFGTQFGVNSTSITSQIIIPMQPLQIRMVAGETMEMAYRLGNSSAGNLVSGGGFFFGGELVTAAI